MYRVWGCGIVDKLGSEVQRSRSWADWLWSKKVDASPTAPHPILWGYLSFMHWLCENIKHREMIYRQAAFIDDLLLYCIRSGIIVCIWSERIKGLTKINLNLLKSDRELRGWVCSVGLLTRHTIGHFGDEGDSRQLRYFHLYIDSILCSHVMPNNHNDICSPLSQGKETRDIWWEMLSNMFETDLQTTKFNSQQRLCSLTTDGDNRTQSYFWKKNKYYSLWLECRGVSGCKLRNNLCLKKTILMLHTITSTYVNRFW